MKKKFLAILLAITALFLVFSRSGRNVLAQEIEPVQATAAPEEVKIYLFYNEACPHCEKEREFLAGLIKKYPEIKVEQYEVVSNPQNKELMNSFYEKYSVPEDQWGWVPLTFTPTEYFIGFNDQIGKQIESCIEKCVGTGQVVPQRIKLPVVGEVDPSKISLPLLTLALGALDGFNPCAMWILVILISLILPLKSRKKILLVGGTFIFAEGLLYFLFMSAWLNAFLAVSYVYLTRVAIGIFGMVFGIWRIREFLTWKPGVCKVVETTKSQERLVDRMNRVLKPTAIPATILGVIILAFSVNLVEFFCSAGFPVIYTRILALQNLGTFKYYLYLFFYNIFYMLDDFIVFGVAFFGLSRFNFSDKYSRYSTLIAGIVIAILGALLILKPNLLMLG